ncbi:hypothetical protein PACTADRAFT_49938 [Pachysolen tannophilus NRRL Y-2460]|uniref:Uncharacterized protein n=1 Tax=Pachysolen tannophilus NRRL Y-2460 TaxID=669874 RepID=A0A1E4TTX7_PACTA|nr:hypothetical protein PACTADRAFT_49938 [Pachysolen tannophilus NRRL Y-2460]
MSTRKSSRIRRLSERAKEMSSTTANERVVVVPHRSVLKDLKSINNINNVIVEEDKLQSMHGLSRKFQQDNEDNVNSQINFKRRKLDSELSESEQELVKNEPCEKDQLYHEDISNFLMPVNNILNFINIKSTDDNDDDILKIEHQSPIMRDDNESNDNNNDEIDSDSLIKESERKFEKLLAITSDSTEKFENFSWIRNNDGLERWPIYNTTRKKFSSTTTSQPADDRIQHLSLEEYLNYDSMSSLTDDDSESEVSEKSSPAP